jgi:hypothetical protein
VKAHYTPTYSSWLNQVDNWFARIQRDVITRGVFTSVKDLKKKLHPPVQQRPKAAEVEVRKPASSHPVRFIWFVGLVSV